MKHAIFYSSLVMLFMVACSKDNPEPTPNPPTPTINAPGKATLKSPANNQACEELNSAGQVSFSWEASSDTKRYDLTITNLNTQGVSNQNNITATSTAVSLAKGVPYSWSVTSRNDGSQSSTSTTWQFYLAGDGEVNYAPFPATVISPIPGNVIEPTNDLITLSWSGVDPDQEPLTYTIELDTIDGLQGIAVIENTADTSTQLSLEADTIYYWRIISSDGTNSSTSIVYSFKTAQ